MPMRTLLSIAGFAWACAGCAALSMAIGRYYHRAFPAAPHPPARALLLRIIGWASLAASLLVCTALFGWGVGPTLWLGILMVATIGIVLLLTYAPRWVARWGIASGIVGVLCNIAVALA